MWPFKKTPRPRVQLRRKQEAGFVWWSVFEWKRVDCFGGYWRYVKGSNSEEDIRAIYNAHVARKADGDSIIVEESF